MKASGKMHQLDKCVFDLFLLEIKIGWMIGCMHEKQCGEMHLRVSDFRVLDPIEREAPHA
jgi:hypothetical protein